MQKSSAYSTMDTFVARIGF